MKKHNLFECGLIAVALVYCAGLCCRGNETKGEPSPRDLISLARPIDSSTQGVKSVEVRITTRLGDEGVGASARIASAGPSWLLVFDRVDGTPLLICDGERAIIYDLERGCVHLFSSAQFEALAYVANGKIGVDFALTNRANHIYLDIPSFLSIGSDNLSASLIGVGWTLHASTLHGGLLVAAVLPTKKECPFTSIKLYAKGGGQPVIALEGVQVNMPPSAPEPGMPDEAVVAAKLTVTRTAKAAIDPTARQYEVAVMVKTLAYRVALREPTARANAEQKYGVRIDWDAINARDKFMSAELRGLIGYSCMRIQQSGRGSFTTCLAVELARRSSRQTAAKAAR
jgi:hypothetical protein